MRVTLSGLCQKHTRSRRHVGRRAIETFEARCVLNAVWPTIAEPLPNDTLDIAEDLGELMGELTSRIGSIGDSPAREADVDWYQFTLSQASRVELTSASADVRSGICLSLYNSSPFTGEDLHNPLGHRLLAQTESNRNDGGAQIESMLPAGTYFIAVSGEGNRAFHPFLAGSGYPGETGDYVLGLTSTPLELGPDDGPIVLAADPAIDSSLLSSPFLIRVQLSAELDPGTIFPEETVQVVYSPNETFNDGDDTSVSLAMISFSAPAAELQLTPTLPLPVGYYQVTLAGDAEQRPMVLTDLSGRAFGSCDAFPQGHDFAFEFQITGIEGTEGDSAAADDTPETAHELGTLTEGTLVQANGAIGDDPYYDPNVDSLLNPANDVDLYHFQITGEGTYAFAAEVWAGRIGSPLDAGVSLFRLDPNDSSLQFVTGTNNTFNAAVATNGTLPLFTDATLFAGLTAGDYYIAVSSGFNTPAPAEGQPLGGEGIFDPAQSHSGWAGTNTGCYLLNLQITPDSIAPVVVSTSPSDGDNLSEPPTHLVIGFSETVNLQQLAFEAFLYSTRGDIAAVFIQAADGTQVFPRFESYDSTTNEVTFVMLNALPNGAFELHLSAALGLKDLADNPLTGNDPSGDYVVTFDVSAAPRGTNGNPTQWTSTEPNDDLESPQDLGVLFPQEFAAGIKLTRDSTPSAADTADYYRFEILRRQTYRFGLSGTDLPAHIAFAVLDGDGNAIPTSTSKNGLAKTAALAPGVYFVRVNGWEASVAAELKYQVSLTVLRVTDNPPPLTVGPTPSLQLRLVGTTALPPAPPQVVFENNNQNLADASGNGNVGNQPVGSGGVDVISSGTSPSVGGTTPLPPLPPSAGLESSNQNTASVGGLGNAGPQTNTSVALNLQVPATSLVAFGEHLVGGVGVTANVIASNNGRRIVLQLPEWFEWAGSRDFAFINISSNVRERLLRNEVDEEFDGTVPTPTADVPTSPTRDSNSAQDSGEEILDGEEASLPADANSPESGNRKEAANENAESSDQGPKSTAQETQKNDSVSTADFEWLPALAAVMSGSFSGARDENSRGRKFFTRHRGLPASVGEGAPTNSAESSRLN